MPARSIVQQRVMAIAKHQPTKLFRRNRGLLKMSESQLSHFARTKHKGLIGKKRKLIG